LTFCPPATAFSSLHHHLSTSSYRRKGYCAFFALPSTGLLSFFPTSLLLHRLRTFVTSRLSTSLRCLIPDRQSGQTALTSLYDIRTPPSVHPCFDCLALYVWSCLTVHWHHFFPSLGCEGLLSLLLRCFCRIYQTPYSSPLPQCAAVWIAMPSIVQLSSCDHT
jgi:hypothetical protein